MIESQFNYEWKKSLEEKLPDKENLNMQMKTLQTENESSSKKVSVFLSSLD